MSEHRVSSFAKINLFLNVAEKRPDGYHAIETVFQTIDLADTIVIRPAPNFTLTCSDPAIPVDSRNLVARAFEALRQVTSVPPVAIHIEKRIPAGGGLGGGSSNAAAVLAGLVETFDLAVSRRQLLELALQLGSDVPFFLIGGTAYATGRGEELRELAPAERWPLLLILPPEKVSTPDAYGKLAEMRAGAAFPYCPLIGMERAAALLGTPRANLVGAFRNDLEDPVFAMYPELASWKRELYDAGARLALLSGSGSTIFGIFDDTSQRDAAITALAPRVQALGAKPVG